MEVCLGLPPVVTNLPLVQWLVQQLQVLNRQTIGAGLKKVHINPYSQLLYILFYDLTTM